MDTRLVLISTGGTISMAAANGHGAVPVLHGGDLRRLLPAWSGPLDVIELFHLPSAHFTLQTLWAIRQKVQSLAGDPTVQGIVITHGTDTMEETAYLLDLTVAGDAPIVLTGAMRAASDPGYEGAGNLLAALRVAADPAARGIGAVVVMEDEVHAAREVTKMHTLGLGTFQSPAWGPLGRVEGDRVLLRGRLPRHPICPEQLEERVLLIKLAVGMDDGMLRYALEQGMRGVVLEALGGGRLPPWWLPAVRQAIERGVAVVVGSRCPSGRVYDRYGYAGSHDDQVEAGVLFANGLNGQKARIKLMAALGAGLGENELRKVFDSNP